MIFFTGGPSGSGKTSLAHKMANIVGCEVVSLENYYKPEQVKDFKYDDFAALDLSLLSKVMTWKIYLKSSSFLFSDDYSLVIITNSIGTIVFVIPQNINDIKNRQKTSIPVFDLETGTRSGFKELEVSEDCGVVFHLLFVNQFVILMNCEVKACKSNIFLYLYLLQLIR